MGEAHGNICYPEILTPSHKVRSHIDALLSQRVANDHRQAGRRYFFWKEHIIGLYNEYFIEKDKMCLLQQLQQRSAPKPEDLEKYVQQLILEDMHDRKTLSIREVIRPLGIGEERFRKMLRTEYGCSWRDFVHQCRMEKSKELLLADRTPVGDIAFRLGYMVPAHFSRAFKRYCGQSPATFRRSQMVI